MNQSRNEVMVMIVVMRACTSYRIHVHSAKAGYCHRLCVVSQHILDFGREPTRAECSAYSVPREGEEWSVCGLSGL